MKKLLPGLLLLMFAANSWADFNDGVVAYAMGQYEKAMQTMMPLAANADHPYAQYYVGVMYEKGQGVDQSYDEAVKWFGSSAEQGVSQAQMRLSKLYAAGKGVPQDYEYAFAWASVAQHLGNSYAPPQVGKMAAELSPEELAEAQKLSNQFVQQYGKKPEILSNALKRSEPVN